MNPDAKDPTRARRDFLKLMGLGAATLAAGPLLRTPAFAASAGAGQHVFGLRSDGKVVVIDTGNDSLVKVIETGGKGGTLGSLTQDGSRLFVANNGPAQRALTVIDTQTLEKVADIETGNRPKHPVVSPDGALVAVNHSQLDSGGFRVVFISTKDLKIVKTVDVPVEKTDAPGDFSMHGSWSPDGKLFAIGSYADNKVALIDGETLSLVSLTPVPGNPHYFDWFGREAWVTVEAGEPKEAGSLPVVVVMDTKDAAAPKIIDRLTMALEGSETADLARVEGHHATLSNDGTLVIACNRGSGKALEGVSVDVYSRADRKPKAHLNTEAKGVGHAYCSPDGRYALLTQYNDTKVPVLDLANLKIAAVIDAGKGGHMGHVAFSPDGHKAYINNRKADEVVVVDMGTLAIVGRIQTAPAGEGQGMVLNRYYNVFERVVNPNLG